MTNRKRYKKMDPHLVDEEFANFIEAGDKLTPIQVRLMAKNIRIELERMAEIERTDVDECECDGEDEYMYSMIERRIEKSIPRVFGMLTERLYETKAFLKREEREREAA
jgi:hypothetical protein